MYVCIHMYIYIYAPTHICVIIILCYVIAIYVCYANSILDVPVEFPEVCRIRQRSPPQHTLQTLEYSFCKD